MSQDVTESGSFLAVSGEKRVVRLFVAVVVAILWNTLRFPFTVVVFARRHTFLACLPVTELVRSVRHTIPRSSAEVVHRARDASLATHGVLGSRDTLRSAHTVVVCLGGFALLDDHLVTLVV